MYRSTSLLFLVLLLLVGCRARHKHNVAADIGPREVSIEWLGHGCFRVTSSIGLTIITDPFNPHATGKVATVPADVVLITHEDDTANFTDLVSGSPIIFRSSMANGVNRASGVLVRGIQTSSESLAASVKLNVAYTWSMDGIRFCTLGAIEDALTPSEALNVGRVDVLFLPYGGSPNFTRCQTSRNDRTASAEDHRADGRRIALRPERRPYQRKSVHADRISTADNNDGLRTVLSVNSPR